ncbi:heparinase II/III domain-containing protein [Nonomuraea sp. NPDC003727]
MSAAYTPAWPAIRRRLETRPWAAEILTAIRSDFTRWSRDLVIPGPDQPSAWTHHYFCDADGAPLVFDAATPARHACSACDRVYRGEPWDGAWRTTMHDAAAVQAQRAALLVRLSDTAAEAAAELERLAAAYARHYLSYEPHGGNAGQGRVQPQSLDEAVWAVGLLRALRWAGDVLSPATSAAVDAMASAIADLLRPQAGMVHNIHCWLLAALAECAARLGDRNLTEWCRDAPFGAEAQVMEGFHPEGLWYEINAHYHYYAVAALLSYREAAGPEGLSERAARRLARAIAAPPSLAYADTRLPAYGDGWAECHVGDFAAQAEAACTLLPEAAVDLAPYYERRRPGPVRPWFGRPDALPGGVDVGYRSSVAALLFGPDEVPAASPSTAPASGTSRKPAGSPAAPASGTDRKPAGSPAAPASGTSRSPAGSPAASRYFAPDRVAGRRSSFVWPHAGIGVLRSPAVRLAMRFGPDAGWHDHRDKLNVDVETATGWYSLDLGTSGYGSAFTAWMRSPLAHNVAIVDGARQPPHTGRLLESSERRLVAESAWEGNVLRRSVAVTDDGWTDEVTVTLPSARRIEWAFHGDGLFSPDPTRDHPATPSTCPPSDSPDPTPDHPAAPSTCPPSDSPDPTPDHPAAPSTGPPSGSPAQGVREPSASARHGREPSSSRPACEPRDPSDSAAHSTGVSCSSTISPSGPCDAGSKVPRDVRPENVGAAGSASPRDARPGNGGDARPEGRDAGVLGQEAAALRDVRRLAVPADGILRGTWDFDGAPHLALAVPDGFAAYAATAEGNPNGRPLGLLILRGHAARARFRATFTVSERRRRAAPGTAP